MRLKLLLTEREVLIYREKWGVIAYVATLGGACLAIAAFSYFFLSNQAGVPKPFLIAFSSLFGLVGAAVMLRLPAMANKAFEERGAHVLSADSLGISISANIGAKRLSVLWTSIEEVVVAKNFKTLEIGETNYVGRAVIVFLMRDEFDSWSFADRINAAVSRSGSGRPYLHVPFPRNEESILTQALHQYAPAPVQVRTENHAIFDYKMNADSYSNA